MAEKHGHEHAHKPTAEGRPGMVLPPAAQQLLIQLQTFQQQYQTVAIQKESLVIQKLELDKALDELGKTGDREEVFKAVGPVLIRSTKPSLGKELSEKRETVEARLKSVDAQEKKLREKINEVQSKLQSMLAGAEPEGHVEGVEEGESAG